MPNKIRIFTLPIQRIMEIGNEDLAYTGVLHAYFPSDKLNENEAVVINRKKLARMVDELANELKIRFSNYENRSSRGDDVDFEGKNYVLTRLSKEHRAIDEIYSA